MAICAENLEPGGVAYVSYNTDPGWRMRQMLRDMLCYHTRDFRDPRERAGHARALLGFLSEKVLWPPGDGDLLVREGWL